MSHHQPAFPTTQRKRKREQTSRKNKHDGTSTTTTFDDVHSIDVAEYLARVSTEATALPDVFTADHVDHSIAVVAYDDATRRRNNAIMGDDEHPIVGSAASLSYLVSDQASLTTAPSPAYLPSKPEEWVPLTLSHFERVREYLEECKRKGIGGKRTQRMPLPPMKERDGWLQFCLGRQQRNDDDSLEAKKKELLDYYGGEETQRSIPPSWQQDIPSNGHPATVQLVCQLDQVLVRKVLSHLSRHIQDQVMCHNTTSTGVSLLTLQCAPWMYALLARLEKPVHRDDAAVLFGTIKALTKARAVANVESNNTATAATAATGKDDGMMQTSRPDLARLNVLIAIIGIYFEQGGKDVMQNHATPVQASTERIIQ